MKIESTINDEHQAELVVELEPDVLESAKRKAAKKIAKQIKVAGFRPGKAPYNVVLQQVGEGAIVEEALDLVIDEYYPKILEEADIEPYGPGALKNVPNLDPPTLEITVPLAPEVELSDYHALRIPYEEKEVTEDDINKTLDTMRDQQAIIEPVDRPAEEGDMVNVVLSAKRTNAEEAENTGLIEERTVPIVIEKETTKSDDEWPFPGYSRKLIGKSPGDNITSKHTFGKKYPQEELQGVKAEYKTNIEDIKGRSLPDFDDEFAKSAGDYETFQELKDSVIESLKNKFVDEQNAEYDNSIIDSILEGTSFKITTQMLDHEIEHQLEDLTRNLQSQGLDMDVYLKSQDMELEAFKDDIRPSAQDRLHRGLILSEIAKREEVELDSKVVEERTKLMTENIRQIFPRDEAKKLLTPEYIQNLSRNIINDEITNKTLELIRSIAKGEYKKEEVKPSEQEPDDSHEKESEVETENS